MYTYNNNDTNNFRDILDRLASQYRASLALLGSVDDTSTEFIFDYQLKMQQIEHASKKINEGQQVEPHIYQQFVEDYRTFFP